ncbi:hypothetical protein HYFRA_00007779 [Hymenoscyphus fraxineus]|uniref:MARVEL domain-containing protein n=1 Tax=Hymenoscyphus fraxineus TaxID=746836 RepID=A0A9N9KP51_9HELO|nr:hypothetical protein HYFRA_00007779 [Hymenoscyphus fraxineus]
MAFWGKNKGSKQSRVSVAGVEPLRQTSTTSSEFQLSEAEKMDLIYKKHIRAMRFVSRFLSAILNALMIVTLSYTLYSYFTTKSHQVNGTSIWGASPTLWPSIALLAVSALTFVLNVIALLSYCRSVEAANKVSNVASYVGYAVLAIHVITWIAASAAYRIFRTGRDLWGYSCSSKADSIQSSVQGIVNFDRLCTLQGHTWFVSVAQAILYVLTFLTTILMVVRANQKKKISRIRESVAMETEYVQNMSMGRLRPLALGGNKYMPLAG